MMTNEEVEALPTVAGGGVIIGKHGLIEVLEALAEWRRNCEDARRLLAAQPLLRVVINERDIARGELEKARYEIECLNIERDEAKELVAYNERVETRMAQIEELKADLEKARSAALEDAASHAEDWTCPVCDTDNADELAAEIRALSNPAPTESARGKK